MLKLLSTSETSLSNLDHLWVAFQSVKLMQNAQVITLIQIQALLLLSLLNLMLLKQSLLR